MSYSDIKKKLWFKEGIKEIDKLDIEKCISEIKEEIVVETKHFEFTKAYGSILMCEVLSKYFKNNSMSFFVNYYLITNVLAMGNKKKIEELFELKNFSKNKDININENIKHITKKVIESDFASEMNLYIFLFRELGEEMISKNDFDELMLSINRITNEKITKVIENISHREHFSNHTQKEKKKIIETMIYYSYINEVLFITNPLRVNFLTHVVINDFINNPLFKDYIHLLLKISAESKKLMNIFMVAPTGEILIKEERKTLDLGKELVEFNLQKYNEEALSYIEEKYKKVTLLEKIKNLLKL